MRYICFIILLLSSIITYSYECKIVSISPQGQTIKIDALTKGEQTVFQSYQTLTIKSGQKVKVRIPSFPKPQTRVIIGSDFIKKGYNTFEDFITKKKSTKRPKGIIEDAEFRHSEFSYKFPEKRIALIIGNGDYEKDPLPLCIADAYDVANKLDTLGFDSFTLYNLAFEEIDHAVGSFCDTIKSHEYEVALVYYSGHGAQIDGEQFIIPVNANDKSGYFPLENISIRLSRTNATDKLIFLDACRSPRYNDMFTASTDNDKVNDAFIVFATDGNMDAYAGNDEDANSPFTAAFLNVVGKPHNSINDAINDMKDILVKKSYPKPVIRSVGTKFTFYNEVDLTPVFSTVSNLSRKFVEDLDNHILGGVVSFITQIDSIAAKYNLSYDDLPAEYEYAIRRLSRTLNKEGLNLLHVFPLKQSFLSTIWFHDNAHIAMAEPSIKHIANTGFEYCKWGLYDGTNEQRILYPENDYSIIENYFERTGFKKGSYYLTTENSCFVVRNFWTSQLLGFPVPCPSKALEKTLLVDSGQLQYRFSKRKMNELVVSCDSTLYLGNIGTGSLEQVIKLNFPIDKIILHPNDGNVVAIVSQKDSLVAICNIEKRLLTKSHKLDFSPTNAVYSAKEDILVFGCDNLVLFNKSLKKKESIHTKLFQTILDCVFDDEGNILLVIYGIPSEEAEVYTLNDFIKTTYSKLSPLGRYAIDRNNNKYVLMDVFKEKIIPPFEIDANTSGINMFNRSSSHFIYHQVNESDKPSFRYYLYDINQLQSIYLFDRSPTDGIILNNDASAVIVYDSYPDNIIQVFDVKRKKYTSEMPYNYSKIKYDYYSDQIYCISNDTIRILTMDFRVKDVIRLSFNKVNCFSFSKKFIYLTNNIGDLYRIKKEDLHQEPEFLFKYNKVISSIEVDDNDNYITTYINGGLIDTNWTRGQCDAKVWSLKSMSLVEDLSELQPYQLIWNHDRDGDVILDLGRYAIDFDSVTNITNSIKNFFIGNNQ